MIFLGAYAGIALAIFYGGAYFSPNTVHRFDGIRSPPWLAIALAWPISIIVRLLMLSLAMMINSYDVVLNAGLERQARKERYAFNKKQMQDRLDYDTRARVSTTDKKDNFDVEAEQEVEICLREDTL